MPADPIATAAATDRRQHPRWTTAGLESALGHVSDLSLSGMRIRRTADPGLRDGDRFRLEVRFEDSVFLLPAQLVTARPHAGGDGGEGGGASGGLVDLGIRFPDLTRAQKRSVKSLLTASGFPDGGGEIVFQALLGGDEAEAPAAAAEPEPAAPAAEAPEPSAPAPAPSLRRWSQLTEAADATPPAAEPLVPDAPPPAAASAEPAAEDAGGLSAAEAEELAAFERVAESAGALAEEAASAAAPESSPAPPARGGPRRAFEGAPVEALPDEGNQRKNGRIAAQDAHTALGQVLDISASGMRIRRRGRRPVSVGDAFLLDLYVCGRAVRLPVEVMRIQKAGWRTHDYGLRFGELPPEMRAQFGQVARMAAKHVSIA